MGKGIINSNEDRVDKSIDIREIIKYMSALMRFQEVEHYEIVSGVLSFKVDDSVRKIDLRKPMTLSDIAYKVGIQIPYNEAIVPSETSLGQGYETDGL